MKTKILTGAEARRLVQSGLNKTADCVKVTLGPSGRNAILGRINNTPTITNDGVSIARHIELEDPFEEIGAKIVKEAAALTDKKSGDGTTTTTVILQKLVNDCFAKLDGKSTLMKAMSVDTIKLKKEIDIACKDVVEKLKKASRPITLNEIYNVAMVSVEYEWLAKIVADIFQKIGASGFVTIAEGGLKTDYEIVKGYEIGAGYTSEYFINDDKRRCVVQQPNVLITNHRITDIEQFAVTFKKLVNAGKNNLVIVAPEFSSDVIKELVTVKLQNNITVLALRFPLFGKDAQYKELAALTNATFIDSQVFKTLADIETTHLGTCEKVVAGESTTHFIDGKGDTSIVVAEVKKLLEETTSEFDKHKLEQRVAYLTGGIANITIGAETDSERTYFRLKLEDAINAVRNALADGVVAGGGLALKKIAEELPPSIITEALKSPYRQIQENAGGTLDIPDTVLDPVKTTISALNNACSLAGMLLTTEVVIAPELEKSEKENGYRD